MKHSVIALLVALISTMGICAQDTDGSKILVFRNTGEINIFNSDSISKVELSVFDADSIAHDEFVSQVFHHKNTSTVTIPLAEIDSVAFGYRNIIEPKKGVRRLSDQEAEAISSFDGETLLYDSRLTLTAGETVYYDRITDNLPIGLCVKVNNVSEESNGHKAEVSVLDPRDAFDRYLMTGDSYSDATTTMKKADEYDNELLKLSLPEFDKDGVKISGSVEFAFNAELMNVVKDLVNDYYHAEIKFSASPKIEFKASSEDSNLINLELPDNLKIKRSIPFLWGALKLDLILDDFLDLNAEAGLNYELEQEHSIVMEWTRNKGKNTFGKPDNQSNATNETTQKIEVHLNGELFLGLKVDIGISTALDIAGAGLEIKVGPKLEAEFGLGVINQLSQKYDEEAYGKANLYYSTGAKIETYEHHRTWKNPFVIVKNKLPFNAEIFSEPDTIRLFPEFNSKAVLAKETAPIVQTGNEPDAVTISTFVEEEIAHPLDISFELADKANDETIAETEVIDAIEMETEDTQTLYTDITIPSSLGKIDKDAVIARPVINYKGYKIKAAPANVAGDMMLTPNICSLAGVSTYFVSGMTPVSQHSFDDTTYIEGNLIGYGAKGDSRHRKRKFKMYEFIDLSDPASCNSMHGEPASLFGEWVGTIADEDVIITFSDNENGVFNGIPFTYKYNSPRRGGIAIQLTEGGTISFSIADITDGSLTLLMNGSEHEVVLNRKR